MDMIRYHIAEREREREKEKEKIFYFFSFFCFIKTSLKKLLKIKKLDKNKKYGIF